MALNLTIVNKWLWGKHSFIHPEELGLVLPSYYDAPMEDRNFIQNGILQSGDLKTEIVSDKLIMEPGNISLSGTRYQLFPSESVFEFIETTEQRLSVSMSNTFRPIVATFKYITINSDIFVTYNKIYKLVYKDDVASTPDSFAIVADKDGHIVKISSAPQTNINATLTRSTVTEPFRMPLFPLKTMDATTPISNETLDRFLGTINTTDNILSIDAVGISFPCIFYVPSGTIMNKTIIEHLPSSGSFIAMSNNG